MINLTKMASDIGKKILSMLGKERIVTSSEVAEKLGVSWNTAEKALLELVIEGEIDRIKKVGVNLWTLK
jgi:Mn-dependent DtxR family transcriptional regulator